MLRADRTTALPVELANELRDALRRRQKELPARWLAAADADALGDAAAPVSGHAFEALETHLGLAILNERLGDARPRGIVCVRPSGSAANVALVSSLCARGSVTSIVATELDSRLAVEMLDRIGKSNTGHTSIALSCDCTIDLPLPDDFPRPRIYLCLGNVLGCSTTVGAVRLLRVLRSTMSPSDAIVLGLDTRRDSADAPAIAELGSAAERHLTALGLLDSTLGGCFDATRFDYRRTYDAENLRVETHLVARRAFGVEVPGVCDVRFKKGESIRTSVSCTFDRSRVTAMLAGVGLGLRDWTTDTEGRYVVALATPAI